MQLLSSHEGSIRPHSGKVAVVAKEKRANQSVVEATFIERDGFNFKLNR